MVTAKARHHPPLMFPCICYYFLILLQLSFIVVVVVSNNNNENDNDESSYGGIDVSFPMQRHHVIPSSTESEDDSRQVFYENYMSGCAGFSPINICEQSEKDRIDLNKNQPMISQNYTSAGYAKINVPSGLMKSIRKFWKEHTGEDGYEFDWDNEETYPINMKKEKWSKGNTYVNSWEVPSYMLNIQKHGGQELTNLIMDTTRKTLENWIGSKNPLVATSLYGIRVYKQGAVLAPHVDRLPLVISAIINVDQDVDSDEDWPLEVIGHDGMAHNITMKPGEMILYESHSIIHGRPYPLKGKFYANLFVHFEPYGYTQRHEARMKQQINANNNKKKQGTKRNNLKEMYEKAMKRQSSSNEEEETENSKKELPYYIDDDTIEAKMWKQEYKYVDVPSNKKDSWKRNEIGQTEAHTAAANGELDLLKELASKDPAILTSKDKNGWSPLHEAARAGHTEVVEFLLDNGAEINLASHFGAGDTPYYYAMRKLGHDHATVKLLKRRGGKSKAN